MRDKQAFDEGRAYKWSFTTRKPNKGGPRKSKPTHDTGLTDVSDSSSLSSMTSSRSSKNKRMRQPKRGWDNDNSSTLGTNKRPPKHYTGASPSAAMNDPVLQEAADAGMGAEMATGLDANTSTTPKIPTTFFPKNQGNFPTPTPRPPL